MGAYSDGVSTTLTESGAIFGGPARIKAIYYVAGATAGSVVINDGGASGDAVFEIATPASTTATQFIDLSGCPIYCKTSAYATITNATSVTVVYA